MKYFQNGRFDLIGQRHVNLAFCHLTKIPFFPFATYIEIFNCRKILRTRIDKNRQQRVGCHRWLLPVTAEAQSQVRRSQRVRLTHVGPKAFEQLEFFLNICRELFNIKV